MTTPNIVIILADDLGFSDIAPFGGEIDTPHLQRLADGGVRMSSFYVTPRCSPSRAALMTGHHPHSVGVGVLTTDQRPHGYPGTLSADHATLAERLKARGYRTAMFGKWHLSAERTTPSPAWPTRRGFDRFHGILAGGANYHQPPLVDQERRVGGEELADDYYFTDDITAGGAAYIREHAEDPFFLYMAYTAPHWPLQADEADIAKYRERFRSDWTDLRAARLARVAELGLVSSVETLSDEFAPEWTEDEVEWQVERMAVYAAQVESLDRGVGELLRALEESGTLDDTLIIFSSDNGGSAEELPTGRALFGEDVCPRTTLTGEKISIGNDPNVMPGTATTYQSYGRTWATLSNTPFRMWKRWVHEGGIASPFIAHWPGGGLATGAPVSHAPGHVIDIVASVMDAVGGEHDSEGTSLLPLWREPDAEGDERPFFWEHIGNAAVRRGRWKLVREWDSDWELYDIEADRGETQDLAAAQPGLAAELCELWTEWAESHGVIPWQQVLEGFDARGVPRARARA